MKLLIVGGNRFVGLRLASELSLREDVDLHIANRTGQAPHITQATVHKVDRRHLKTSYLDKDFDVIIDFACFNEDDATASLQHFHNPSRYIVVSSTSVYDPGINLTEAAFNPKAFRLDGPKVASSPELAYQDGKRRAEGLFAQQASWPVVMVRFPFILGPDDYTHRLEFHVDHVVNTKPMHIPERNAQVSMISSVDASRFLSWAIKERFIGPVNVASAQPISMNQLLERIEAHSGRKALLINHATAENTSPYAPKQSHYVNVERVNGFGFRAQPILSWLDPLITSLVGRPNGTRKVH